MFTASLGNGAFVEEKGVRIPLHVSKRGKTSEISCKLWSLFQKARDIRRSGSAARDLANIAAGRCDVFF